jgi:hypothetical protein
MKHLLMSWSRMVFAPEGEGRAASAFDAPPAGAPPAGAPPAGDPPAGAPPAGAPPAGDPPAAKAWYEKLPPERQQYVKNKGWDKAEDPTIAVLDGYENLEKVFGADKAGRTLLLPKDDTDAEALNAIYDKLGRPKDATGYTIEVPEGADPKLANTFKNVFHKEGLSTKQAEVLTKVYKAAELDQLASIKEKHADQVESLQKEWGDGYDGKVEVARAAIKAAGLEAADIKRAENSMGPLKFTKMMEFFGRNYTEAGPPPTETRDGAGNISMSKLTPGQANEKMMLLRADKNFIDRYNNNDPRIREGAMKEMDALAKIAVQAQQR